MRPTRTAFGAHHRGGRPVLTRSIIAVTVVVFVLQLLPIRIQGFSVTDWLAFHPLVAESQPWRWLTYALVHSEGSFGVVHVGMNMFGLYLIGPLLEEQFGRARFLALWLLSIFGGAVAYALLTLGAGAVPGVVGASGGVFGLFGAWFVVARRLGRDASAIMTIIVINIVFGFLVSGIAWQGHLGGLVVGAAVAAILAHAPARGRTLVQWGGIGATTAVLLVLAAFTATV